MKKLPPIQRHMSWVDFFGEKSSETTEKYRRQRWEEWKVIAIAAGDQEVVDYWAKDNLEEACGACIHRDNDWCKAVGLPCNINPILTFRCGLIGMACMGLGKQLKPEQLNLFDETE